MTVSFQCALIMVVSFQCALNYDGVFSVCCLFLSLCRAYILACISNDIYVAYNYVLLMSKCAMMLMNSRIVFFRVSLTCVPLYHSLTCDDVLWKPAVLCRWLGGGGGGNGASVAHVHCVARDVSTGRHPPRAQRMEGRLLHLSTCSSSRQTPHYRDCQLAAGLNGVPAARAATIKQAREASGLCRAATGYGVFHTSTPSFHL